MNIVANKLTEKVSCTEVFKNLTNELTQYVYMKAAYFTYIKDLVMIWS